MKTNEKIDFVMLWVDGNDEAWKEQRAKYAPKTCVNNSVDNSDNRFRDWDNLQYWFRGVEKFTPWVHKVYFITNGQKPKWLNENAEKLICIQHSDYIPEKYLPTFNSHVIETNLHRIEGLSNHFVYFNDDTFITNYCSPEVFYKNGLPVHPAILRPIIVSKTSSLLLAHVYTNMLHIINKHFDVRKSIRNNWSKWISPKKYGFAHSFSNFILSNYVAFPGFQNEHLPIPIVKDTMKEVWQKEEEMLLSTSSHRFRSSEDVSQFVFRYWDLASGNFEPISVQSLGKYFGLGEDRGQKECKNACEAIKKQKYKMVCLNDCYEQYENFEWAKKMINEELEHLLSKKSSFEK